MDMLNAGITGNKKMNLVRFSILIYLLAGCKNPDNTIDYLLLFSDTSTNEYGYKDQQGKIIIPQGKYQFCFTDTFKTYAIVLKQDSGFIAIDRREKSLYKVFTFDNGPDNPSEGFFRIVENNKIGYADAATGKVLINPQFDCAFPFEGGKAKVSTDCKIKAEGEHSEWLSNNWFYIDKNGKRTDK